MKRKCKLFIDVVMYFCFLYLMSYRAGRGFLLHGVFGCGLLFLFLLHHILNLRWYGSLWKGKYSLTRAAFVIIDGFLLATMLGMAASSLMLSGDIFSFSPFLSNRTARVLHTFSTAWGFMLTVFHVGLHTHAPLEKLRKKADASIFGYAYYLFFALLLLAGLYCLGQSSLWKNMLLLPKGNASFEVSVFYIQYGMITLAGCQLIYLLMRLFQRIRKIKNTEM